MMVCCSEKCQSELTEALALGFDLHEMGEHRVIGFVEPNAPSDSAN